MLQNFGVAFPIVYFTICTLWVGGMSAALAWSEVAIGWPKGIRATKGIFLFSAAVLLNVLWYFNSIYRDPEWVALHRDKLLAEGCWVVASVYVLVILSLVLSRRGPRILRLCTILTTAECSFWVVLLVLGLIA